MDLRFGVQSAQHRSRPVSAQQMLNCYLEIAPTAAKSPVCVVPSFGIADFATPGTGPLRGGTVVNGVLYVVSGYGLYRVDSNGSSLYLGDVPGSFPVIMAGDGNTIFIAANGDGYLWDGSTCALIEDPDFPGSKWVAFLDGYYAVGPGDGTVYINETAYVPKVWNALDFANAEVSPDDIVRGFTEHSELLLFGRDSIEPWYNSGDPDFPLTRTVAGVAEIGVLSLHAVGKIDNSVFFAASDFTFRRLDGYNPAIISTPAVSQAIEGYADKSCTVFTWSESGHSMVAFSFAEATWVYDCSTQLLHQRQSYGLANWRAAFVLQAHGRYLVGDTQSNKVGVLTPDLFTEWGDTLVASATSPSIWSAQEPLTHGPLELIFETGVGLLEGQGSDPQVMLRHSDDGGRSWPPNERWTSLGRIGATQTRAVFHRNGQSHDRVYRYTISDPVRRTLIAATVDAY